MAGITTNTSKCVLLLYQAGSSDCEIFGQLENTGTNKAYYTVQVKLIEHSEDQTNERHYPHCF